MDIEKSKPCANSKLNVQRMAGASGEAKDLLPLATYHLPFLHPSIVSHD